MSVRLLHTHLQRIKAKLGELRRATLAVRLAGAGRRRWRRIGPWGIMAPTR